MEGARATDENPRRGATLLGREPASATTPASGARFRELSASSSSSQRDMFEELSVSSSGTGLEVVVDDGDPSGAGPDRSGSRTRAAWIEAAFRGARPRVMATPLVPGKLIPGTRYRILRWLGDGAMGVVYEAEHVDIERRVALKILRPEVCEDPAAVKAFRDEARATGRIGAKQIVDIFDFGELPDGRLMFAMELIEGAPLFKLCEATPVDPGRMIGILRQICKGLAAAHDAGIVHRDIKPDNLLIAVEHGRRDVVKILDFGVAAILADTVGEGSGLVGTPYYLAPEIVNGSSFDARVDLYSVGCTAYELMVGAPPFAYEDIEAALRAHLIEAPIPPSERRPDAVICGPLEAVVLRCLEKDPEDRYASAVELELALCEAQLQAGVLSEWDDLPLPDVDPEERARLLAGYARLGASRVPRRRWLTALAFVLALIVTSTGVLFAIAGDDPDDPRLTHFAELTEQARDAASRALFVYPPFDRPDTPTAYAILEQLDAIADGLGRAQVSESQALREEFADTLVRLGDEYWERPGGKGFAIDYYAQALLFSPEHPKANGRVSYTPGQLAALRDKVERSDFTERDLFIAETLQALAEKDPELRARKIEALSRGEELATSTRADLEGLVYAEEGARPRTKPAAHRAAARDGETDGAAEDDGSASAERGEDDGANADALVRRGREAMSAGRLDEAARLFERAIAQNRRSAQAHIGLAELHFNRGDYDKAVSHANRAVSLRPKRASYRITLGDALYKVYKYEEALKHYRRAAELGHPEARRRITKVEAKLRG
ncbi:MAG: serine/threonine-protein kinase [Nannocystaceae bacterium]